MHVREKLEIRHRPALVCTYIQYNYVHVYTYMYHLICPVSQIGQTRATSTCIDDQVIESCDRFKTRAKSKVSFLPGMAES